MSESGAEAARRAVEEWKEDNHIDPASDQYNIIDNEDIDDLVARLAPIFEWAQLADIYRHEREPEWSRISAHLRERAERAEERCRNYATVERAMVSREQSFRDSLEAGEADVARLREALQKITTITDRHWPYTSPATDIAREALAATRPPTRREGGE